VEFVGSRVRPSRRAAAQQRQRAGVTLLHYEGFTAGVVSVSVAGGGNRRGNFTVLRSKRGEVTKPMRRTRGVHVTSAPQSLWSQTTACARGSGSD